MPKGACTAKVYDVMLMQHLCFPDLPHDLEFIGSQFSNKPAWKDDKGILERYCCRDTDVTLQAWLQLKTLLRQYGLEQLYHNVQVPLAKICHLMQQTGVKVNPNRIHEVRDKLIEESTALEKPLPEHMRTHTVKVNKRQPAPPGTLSEKTGKPLKYIKVEADKEIVPWRSDVATKEYLYAELGLPAQLNAKTEQITTDKVAIEKLQRLAKRETKWQPHVQAIQAISKLRKLDELLTTFCKETMTKVERMHPHFNVHGTSSGRLSSSDPNLQNVPETARYIYVPSHPDWEFIEVDYSQIENRLTAYFANDTGRLERFLKDPNFSEHRWAASKFFDIPYDEVVKDNDKDAPYGKAKRIVHGVNYGMGWKKICNMYDMEAKEVKQMLAQWKSLIMPTAIWQERTAERAYKEGYLATPFGRKRWFYTTSYFTESLSFLPQSTAADIIFRAMIGLMYERISLPLEKALKVVKVVEPLPWPGRLLLQVHDSLLFEVPREKRDETIAAITKVMTQPWPELGGFGIPISVAVSGLSWGEVKKL